MFQFNDKDLYWMIGLLEGEGCFMTTKTTIEICLAMTDKDTVARYCSLLQIPLKARNKIPKLGTKICYYGSLYGKRAYYFMSLIKSEMCERRQVAIQKALDSYDLSKSHYTIEEERTVIDLTVKGFNTAHLADLFGKSYKSVDAVKSRLRKEGRLSDVKVKEYRFVSPSGEVKLVKNLTKFCVHENLRTEKMSEVNNSKRKSHKGWTKYKVPNE